MNEVHGQHRAWVLLNAAILSFCGFGYQQLVAVVLADATGDFVLSQAVSLGLYLFGMGLGCPARLGPAKSRADVLSAYSRLLRVEWSLALLGASSSSLLRLSETALKMTALTQPVYLLAAAAPVVVVLGFLGGQEVPLLLELAGTSKPGFVLGAGYGGAFVAALAVPILMLPLLDASGTSLTLGALNLIAASMLLALPLRSGDRWKRRSYWSHGVVAVLLLLNSRIQPRLDAFHLQTVYFTPRITSLNELKTTWDWWNRVGDPIRIRSHYQWIDLLPPEFTERVQGLQDFQLYLDRRIQFSAGNWKRYHESMAHGAADLLGYAPGRVLILGGGDGLLAAEVLKYPSVGSLDLVELDPAILELANRQKDLTRLNRNSLKNPKVHVHVEDAFQFLRARPARYDLILADLPFPVNYELSLLFTREFYALARAALSDDGIMVLDFPLPGGPGDDLSDLLQTLRAAGFSKPFAFGADDFFVAVSRQGSNLSFKPDHLAPMVSNQTLFNLISRAPDVEHALSRGGRVNSVLFPKRFSPLESWSRERPAQKISYADNGPLLPMILDRFAAAWGAPMPVLLEKYWRQNMRESRDFSEDLIPGLSWPRFQWGLEARGDRLLPLFQWFDVHNPAPLRAIWTRTFGISDPTNWVGVNWTADRSEVEFVTPDGRALKVRRYESGVFKGEQRVEAEQFARRLAGAEVPIPNNARAAEIQFRFQREFLINPRMSYKNKFYFP